MLDLAYTAVPDCDTHVDGTSSAAPTFDAALRSGVSRPAIARSSTGGTDGGAVGNAAVAASPGIDGCLGELTCEEARELAETDAQRRLIDGVATLVRDQTPVPFGTFGPCHLSVLALIGFDPDEAHEQPDLAILLQRLSHALTPLKGRRAEVAKAADIRKFTLVATIRAKVARLPHGTLIPRFGRKRVAWEGVAAMLDISYTLLACNPDAKRAVLDGLAIGRFFLGAKYDAGKFSTKEVEVARRRGMDALRSFREGPDAGPIPMTGSRRRVARELIFERAGISDPRLQERIWRDTAFRKELGRTIEAVSTVHGGERRISTTDPTFRELREMGADAAVEAYRRRKGEGDANGEARARGNERTYLNRIMRQNGWTDDDGVERPLLGPDADDAARKGLTASAGGNKLYLESIDRFRSLARRVIDGRKGELTFGQRVMSAIDRLGMTQAGVARHLEVAPDVIHRWISGRNSPTFMQVHLVHRLEDLLGFVRDELIVTLGDLREGRVRVAPREVTLPDGRAVDIRKYLRFLPQGAAGWSDERLAEAVGKADASHFGTKTANSVRQKAVMRLSKEQGELDVDMPLWTEWQDLVAFKTCLAGDPRDLCPTWEWRSPRTIEKNLNLLRGFARFAVLPTEEGGLGLEPGQVALYLLFNRDNVEKYIFHRTLRWSHLTIDGRELGPMLGGTELAFVALVKSLMDVEYGYVPQSRDRMHAPEVIARSYPIEELREIEKRMVVSMPAGPRMCEIMPAKLVEEIGSDWTGAAMRSRRHAASLFGKIDRHYKMIRNPHELVMPILISDHPIACVVQSIFDAMRRIPPLETHPSDHAREYRNIVMMLLLVTVVFRSETLRDMLYRADGTGDLIRTKEGWDVVVGSDRFKNGFCSWLFGPSFRRSDYERALDDWGGFHEILAHYVDVCRPILLKGRESDLLFPTGQKAEKWTDSTFGTAIKDWTRTWSVRNERHQTGMEGVLPWGPHCIRDIVATHIIRNVEGEGRWELAAIILCASVEVVKKHYALVDRRRELAKADGLFHQAFAIGIAGRAY